MASSFLSFVVVNIANEGGKNRNRQQNGCWAKEIGFYYEGEMSPLKGQLGTWNFFNDRFASLLDVYCGLKSISWNCKRKTIFSLTKLKLMDWIINQNTNA